MILRAQFLKAEIKELENLRHKLKERESITKEINIYLRTKQEELSEMNVRKEMAEKKLSNLIRDHEVALEKLTVAIHSLRVHQIMSNCIMLYFSAQIGRQSTPIEA